MRTYDISHVTGGAQAALCAQDDGQKVWKFDPEWKDFWVDADKRRAIEQAVDHAPNETIIWGEGSVEGFTIRKRSAENPPHGG